jgi:hypothetical protein
MKDGNNKIGKELNKEIIDSTNTIINKDRRS